MKYAEKKHVGCMSIRGFEALSCNVCPGKDLRPEHSQGSINNACIQDAREG